MLLPCALPAPRKGKLTGAMGGGTDEGGDGDDDIEAMQERAAVDLADEDADNEAAEDGEDEVALRCAPFRVRVFA